ncbi:response regulator transcription factor [Paenibacillus sp. strain BS8-2]
MYHVAVVDDEILIRKGIQQKLQLDDFKVVFDTDDGELLDQYLIKHGRYAIDVAIIDIEMPLMHGLELVQLLKEKYPHLIIIILSGYSDFQYTQKAIKLGVNDYLLKPVSQKKLYELFDELRDQLVIRNSNWKEKLTADLIGLLSKHGERAIALDKDLLCKWYPQGFRISVSVVGNIHGKMTFPAYNSSNNEIQLAYPGTVNHQVTLHYPDAQYGAIKNVDTFTMFTSGVYDDLRHFDQVVEKARQEIRANLCLGEKVLLEEERMSASLDSSATKSVQTFVVEQQELIRSAIKSQNTDKLTDIFRTILNHPQLPQVFVEGLWRKMAAAIYQAAEEKADEILDDGWLREMDHKEDMIREFANRAQWIVDKANHQQSGKEILQEVIKYIEHHYDENLILKDLADKYFINRSHLSRLFKQQLDKTFNEFLTELRIEKACAMLRSSGFKVKDVATSVGIEDSRYFSQVFKKMTGYSPKEYADNNVPAVKGIVGEHGD